MSTTKKYRGYLTKFLTKKDNGWALGLFGDETNLKAQIKIKGQIGGMKPKVLYEIQGVDETHAKFGTSIQVESYQTAEINSPTQTIKYLASNFFPGVGKKTATAIVEHYQNQVLMKIKTDPDSLFLIPEVSKVQAQVIIQKLSSLKEDDLRPIFYENNLSLEIYEQVKKMANDDEIDLQTIFSTNFFAYARLHRLYPFEQVDKIALHFGLEKTSAERIGYWAERIAINLAMQTGNTYTGLNSLKQHLKKNLNLYDSELLQAGLMYAKNHQLLYFVNQKIYCAEAWEDEQTIVAGLNDLQSKKTSSRLPKNFAQHLKAVEKQVGEIIGQPTFKYDTDQIQALKTFFKSPVSLITGGPGTGKTTLITGIILLAQKVCPTHLVGVATPTGRAAARLNETLIGQHCSTIHKMLEADEHGNFGVNEKYPLNFDLIILDETSMVENHLFAQLIKGRGNKLKKLVLVGDHHQLPPIGYGEIFNDLINSERFGYSQLKVIHRQKQGNGIIDLALAIQNNTVDEIEWKKLSNVETYFDQSLQSNYQMLKLDYALNQEAINHSPFYYQIISPFYAGNLGIENLNTFIQTTFNPQLANSQLVYDRGRYRYAVGDKIMNLKNNPDLDLTNGEVGVIQKLEFLDAKNVRAIAEFSGQKSLVLDNALFNDLALGYACSVHKTQGSEYPKVAFVLSDTPNQFFLNKKLIYTAITRAKTNLLIIADYQLFLNACHREAVPRLTTIQEKLSYEAKTE